MMIQTNHRSRRILAPVRVGFIFTTIVCGILLSFIPTGTFPAVPDFTALILTFWCVREPYKVGIGSGFLAGVLIDVVHGTVLGQHALAYVLLTYTASVMSRRLMWFSPVSQAAHMVPIFLGLQIVMMLTRLVTGGHFPGWDFFFVAFTTAALWIPAHYLLLLPQLQPTEHDENRPI